MPLTNPATINISAGTSSAFLSAITFSNSNGVSFGLNGSTLTGSHNAITSQSTQFLAMTLGGNTAGTTTFHATNNASLFFNGGNNITLSGNGSTVTISAANQTNQSAIKAFGLTNTGNTAGNTGVSTGIDWVLAGSTNITLSESTAVGGPNTIWFSVPSAGAGMAAQIGGNTSGTTAVVSTGTLTLAGGNNITLSQNGNAITISAANQTNQSAIKAFGASNTGNTAGNTGVSTGIDWVMAGTNNITISESTAGGGPNTLWVSAPTITNLTDAMGVSLSSNSNTITIGLSLLSEFAPYPDFIAPVTNSTLGQSTLYFVPFDVQWPISASRINFFMSIGTATAAVNSTGNGSAGIGYGLYTRATGTASFAISQLTSYSALLWSISYSSNTRLSMTHYIGISNATSHSSSQQGSNATNVSTYLANSIGGFRVVALPLNLTMTPGRYYLGFSQQSTTANATAFSANFSILQLTYSNNIAFRPFGTSSAASDASIYGRLPGLGTYSAQSAAWPASVRLSNSDLKLPISATIPYFNISGISTSTNLP